MAVVSSISWPLLLFDHYAYVLFFSRWPARMHTCTFAHMPMLMCPHDTTRLSGTQTRPGTTLSSYPHWCVAQHKLREGLRVHVHLHACLGWA